MKRSLVTIFLLMAGSAGSVAKAEQTNDVSDAAEHCIVANAERTCFKQVVDSDLNSAFFTTFANWDTLIELKNLERTGFEFQVVSDEEYQLLQSNYEISYDLKILQNIAPQSNPTDMVTVLYQSPQRCACAAGVIGGALGGMVAGASAGGKIGLIGGPQAAAGGVVIGGSVGAVAGALAAGERYCKKGSGKKDC